jgi:DNA mismatch repair protein MutL
MHDETNSHLAHNILATLACHSAIRAGEKLDVDDVNDLITEAHGVDFYLNCPHGRRVFKWWKRSEVEHWFDR